MKHRNRVRVISMMVCLTLVWPVSGQTANPPCDDEAYRAFDFWTGHWDVFMKDGTPAGHNSITPEQQGCALIERWQSVRGGTGVSVSFFDLAQKRWRQMWVSPGTQIDISGNRRGDSMLLMGSITYLQDGGHFPFRGTWTLLSDGRVRQFFEEAREPGEWKPWFEGFYQRAEEPEAE